mmetsp:Transcript_41597/g.115771  ORF Transcript_41597/g.115771 Transcript_41597/m.115771 type:complete len:311 (-) Transcript_41597:940-1872(-)
MPSLTLSSLCGAGTRLQASASTDAVQPSCTATHAGAVGACEVPSVLKVTVGAAAGPCAIGACTGGGLWACSKPCGRPMARELLMRRVQTAGLVDLAPPARVPLLCGSPHASSVDGNVSSAHSTVTEHPTGDGDLLSTTPGFAALWGGKATLASLCGGMEREVLLISALADGPADAGLESSRSCWLCTTEQYAGPLLKPEGRVAALRASNLARRSSAMRWKSALRPASTASERASALATSASTWLRSSPECLCKREDSSTRKPTSSSPARRANQAPKSTSSASGSPEGSCVALPCSGVDPMRVGRSLIKET